MAADTLERPRFIEGQYIGADDLDAIVAYHRARHAEHQLAAHTWGIMSGLELFEQENPPGNINVLLLPGYASDGYGRSIIVRRAVVLGVDQLSGRPVGDYQVWLNHRETAQDAVRPGYGVCGCDDEFTRIADGYEVLITGQLSLEQRQSGVQLALGLRADARLARRFLDRDGPFLCDGSVPEQAEHPLGAKARWLVPVGLIHWNGSKLVPRLSLSIQRSRLLRRYVGTVAESVYAPDGLLRLRRRLLQPEVDTPDADVDKFCAKQGPKDGDLVEDVIPPTFEELVWIEGNLRLLGSARLWDGRLEFRDAQGGDSGRPLWLRAKNDTIAPDQTGRDLEVALGKDGKSLDRMVIGPEQKSGSVDPNVIITSDGNVTISGEMSIAKDLSSNFIFTNLLGFVSDKRLKTEIGPIDDALSKFLALPGRSFMFRDVERAKGGRAMGFIADEVQKVFPRWVMTTRSGYKAVATEGFEALAVEAVRELVHQRDALERRVAALEARLAASGPADRPPATAKRAKRDDQP